MSGMDVLLVMETYFLSKRSPASPPMYAKNDPSPKATAVTVPYQYTGASREETTCSGNSAATP